ncbi:MAG TPA: LysR family transcriptional regulator [Ktedonobacteraceae bacterium]|nr:LysR family transcriptional regulator [Ktedonobacteraceae bacterium]
MDIDQLHTFEQIVQQGSFSKAARSLNTTQPTVSSRIIALEQEIGSALFIRGGRHVELTDLGNSFLPYAKQALAALTRGLETARLTRDGRRGRVTIGVLPSLTGNFFSAAIARFHTTHPQVDLFVRTGHSNQLIEELHDGITWLGLITEPLLQPSLQQLLCFQEPLVFVCRADHPLAKKRRIELKEIWNESNPYLFVRWNQEIDSLFLKLKKQGQALMEVPSETARDLLKRGIGTALLTRPLISRELASGKFCELNIVDQPPLQRLSALVCLEHNPDLPASVQQFIEVLRKEARNFLIPEKRPGRSKAQ